MPGPRTRDDRGRGGHFADDVRFVTGQIEELIGVLEKVTGRAFDIDRLREAMASANVLMRSWRQIIALNANRPAVFNALIEGTVYLGVANGLRGSASGAIYFERLLEEMQYKASTGIGALADERYRLAFVGVPCYPIFRRFNDMFRERYGAFVASTYLWFASGGANYDFEYDLASPVESLAEGVLLGSRAAMDAMFHQDRALEEMADSHGLDAIVYHAIKSCRTVSTGLVDARSALAARRDLPSLFLESDMMDRRVVAEAQMKNRIDAFFEGLEARHARHERSAR